MTDDLKPCPFCGGDAEHDGMRGYIPFGKPRGIVYNNAVVYCTQCEAEVVHTCEDTGRLNEFAYDVVQAEIIEAWNRRAASPIRTAAEEV